MISLTWYDYSMGGILIAFVLYEMRQELTRGLIDASAALVALFLAGFWADPLAQLAPKSLAPGGNTAVSFMLLFGFLLAGGMWSGRFVYRTGLELGRSWLDPLWGVVFGLVITAIVGYAVTTGLHTYYGGTAPSYLTDSRVAQPLTTLPSLYGRL